MVRPGGGRSGRRRDRVRARRRLVRSERSGHPGSAHGFSCPRPPSAGFDRRSLCRRGHPGLVFRPGGLDVRGGTGLRDRPGHLLSQRARESPAGGHDGDALRSAISSRSSLSPESTHSGGRPGGCLAGRLSRSGADIPRTRAVRGQRVPSGCQRGGVGRLVLSRLDPHPGSDGGHALSGPLAAHHRQERLSGGVGGPVGLPDAIGGVSRGLWCPSSRPGSRPSATRAVRWTGSTTTAPATR